MPESARECTDSASIELDPEKTKATNLVTAMPRLAAKGRDDGRGPARRAHRIRPLRAVRAVFCYLRAAADGETVAPTNILNRAGLVALVRAVPVD